MANDRPSARRGGYWLSGTQATLPAHVWPEWLADMAGDGVGGNPLVDQELAPAEPAPTFPVPYGGANVLADSRRSPPAMQNLLMAAAGDARPDYSGGELESIGSVRKNDAAPGGFVNIDMHPSKFKELTHPDPLVRRQFRDSIELLNGGESPESMQYWVKRRPGA